MVKNILRGLAFIIFRLRLIVRSLIVRRLIVRRLIVRRLIVRGQLPRLVHL